MADPLVSIIVNNHDYGRFLAACIDSALAQDLPGTEVIVVDDGSTDGSRRVLDGYAGRVRAVLKQNGGQGSAFNAGFAVSRGAVVNFLDADDMLLPDAARRAAAAMAPGVVHWRAPVRLVDGAGADLGTLYPVNPMAVGDLRKRVLDHGPWSYTVVPTSGNFWSRTYLERVLPMPEDRYPLGGDEYLSNISPLYGLLAADSRPAALYRSHGGNVYWRTRLGVEDVADDSFFFERISAEIRLHAGRLGLAVEPEGWLRRDWRQQLRRLILHRAGRRADRPGWTELLGAVLADQTHPAKKAMLLPILGALAALPRGPAVGLGLKLLDRR